MPGTFKVRNLTFTFQPSLHLTLGFSQFFLRVIWMSPMTLTNLHVNKNEQNVNKNGLWTIF